MSLYVSLIEPEFWFDLNISFSGIDPNKYRQTENYRFIMVVS